MGPIDLGPLVLPVWILAIAGAIYLDELTSAEVQEHYDIGTAA